MEDFLNRLYSYEYFGTYLMISIAVLILLFVIILLFGKKDQKKREIEETKKLQQIKSEDAFKEEDNSLKVETEEIKEPVKEENSVNDSVIVPSIEEEPLVSEVDTLPNIPPANEIENLTTSMETIEQVENNNLEKPILNAIPNIEEEKVSEGPVLEPEVETPLVFDSSDAPQIPEFNLDEIIRSTNNIEPAKEDIESLKIEIPKEEEGPKPKEVFSSVFVEEVPKEKVEELKNDDEEDFELPTLKKEPEEEHQEIELPNLNDLSGESYNIK